MKFLPFILFSVALSSFAQLFLRKGMLELSTKVGNSGMLRYLVDISLNKYIIVGMACFGISMITWLFVLSKVNVSIAYPMQCFGYIFVILIAFFAMGEPLTLYKLLGATIICFGVYVLSLSPDA